MSIETLLDRLEAKHIFRSCTPEDMTRSDLTDHEFAAIKAIVNPKEVQWPYRDNGSLQRVANAALEKIKRHRKLRVYEEL